MKSNLGLFSGKAFQVQLAIYFKFPILINAI